MDIRSLDLSRLFFLARGAVQPVLYSWLLFLVFSLFFYAITASAPMLGDATWGSAARLTTCLWITTFGGRCEISMGSAVRNAADSNAVDESLATAVDGSLAMGDGYIQLIPLGLTFLIMYALSVTLRKRMLHRWSEVGVVVALHIAVTGIIGVAMRLQGAWWIGIVGAALCSALCALWAGRSYLFGERPWWQFAESIEPYVKKLLMLLGLYALAALIVALGAGLPSIIDLHKSYIAGIWGSIGLILIQLLYLPTMLIWALSWLLGAGFAVGEGSYFSIFGTQLQPIPAIPVFGALPNNDRWAALVLIPVILGIGWRASKDARTMVTESYTVLSSGIPDNVNAVLDDNAQPVQNAVSGISSENIHELSAPRGKPLSLSLCASRSVAIALAGVTVIVVLGALARGALGPERMLTMGTRPELLLAGALAVIAVPYVLVSFLSAWYELSKAKKQANNCEKTLINTHETSTIQDPRSPDESENASSAHVGDNEKASTADTVDNEEQNNADSI